MSSERCLELLREADAVVNLCGATEPREEHERSRCMVYLETDPGVLQLELARKIPTSVAFAKSHKLFFTYCYNIGAPDCLLPTAGVDWHPTRPPVLLDEWHPGVGPAEPRAFTTVGTWQNNGNDMVIGGETYYWSKHLNFRKVLEVATRAESADRDSRPTLPPAPTTIARSLEDSRLRRSCRCRSISTTIASTSVASRGEFTVAKDLYVRPRTGWFSDRTVCYLAAGRPVVTQRTGFEKFIPDRHGAARIRHA